MPEIKLKPCPFCGGEAELLIVPGKMTKWAVRCTKCYANNGTFVSDHDAVEAWNKRAEPFETVERIISDLGLSNAYDMPSFWYNEGKDYKVIPTRYHKGYMQALEDVEKEVRLAEGASE